jgi:hypothetical protein
MRFLLAAFLLVPAIAAADTNTPDAQQMKTDDCARARRLHQTCTLKMEGEDLTGNGASGGGVRVDTIDFGTSKSLIRIRREFIIEILKSAEDL